MKNVSELTNREKALDWWRNLLFSKQCFLRSKYHPQERQLSTLTGSEIEEIWNGENPIVASPDTSIKEDNLTPHDKEFKDYLIKAFINNLSKEDKMKALNILVCSISTTDIKLNSLLNQISNYK